MMQQRRAARPYVRPIDAPPTTPGGRPHDRINSIFEKLEQNYGLGLTPRDKTWSPSHSGAQEPIDQYQCSQKLKLLYFKGADHLDQALKQFNASALQKPRKDRLPYLRRLLDEGLKRASSAKAEASASRTPLQHRLEQVASSSASHPHTGATSIFNRPQPSARARAVDENVPFYSAMAMPLDEMFVPTQPNTPTAVDDEEPGQAPPSPSLQASVRRQSSHSQRGPRRGKRLSDGSTESEPSPKQRRTSSEKKRVSDASFAVPDPPPMGGRQTGSRSFSSRRQSTAASMTTSFASTRTDSMFSENGDRTRTANTSFATTVPSQPPKVQEDFHSSGTYGTLGSDDWNTAFDEVGEAAKEEDEEPRFRPGIPLDELIERSNCDSSQGPVRSSGEMEHYQVKALPRGGLFVPEVSEDLLVKDFKYRWEFLRVALDSGINDPDQLLPQGYNEEWGEYSCLWDYFRHHDALSDVFDNLRRGSEKAWAAAEIKLEDNSYKAFENVTLKATLSFTNTREGPIFKTRLHPLQLEAASCRFQRAFGGDRFLYLETPVYRADQLPSHLKGQIPAIKERFEEWLGRKCESFLGRAWQPIHVEPIKAKKNTMFRQQEQLRGYRIILFATHATYGHDINPTKKRKVRSGTRYRMSVYDLVNWFMPLDLNSNQPYLKAFSRISLGLTTTLPTLTFSPKQVRYVADIEANSEHEDHRFNDKRLTWPKDKKSNRVMNDGCSRISVGAARLLWKEVNKEGPIPSTFQGRIGGAKGMWMLSASPDTTDPSHCSIWIEVSDSQSKFKPHEDDIESDFDPCRFTFDLHSTTGTAVPSSVYLSFFPILQDRGVPASSLKKLFEGHVGKEREKLLQALNRPQDLRTWVNEQNSLAEERNREDDEMVWQGGMPYQLQEKAVLLLEAGFDTSCAYLTDVTKRLVARSLRLLRQDVRVPLPRCTYVKGVADPLGILAPGEVHLEFTKSFTDEVSGECLNFLDNRNFLVARNPALRRSDIQKVRATFKLELAHLKDVVVFPTRGSFPLAGKLQGGDYDGDTFWVTWEPDLVKPFKNAPPPLEDPVPENYGVKVDRRKLGEMIPERRLVGEFLRESFKFRCKPNLLGPATKLHEKVWYHEKSLISAKAEALVDLHDLLVDYSKNGYEFDDDDFKKFKETFKIPTNIEKPKYEEARQADREEKKVSTKKALARSNSARKHISYNKDNILDRLYFETIEPHTLETLGMLENIFRATSTTDDPALEAPFLAELAEAEHDQVIAEELEALRMELTQIWDVWISELNRKKSASFSSGLGLGGGGGGDVDYDAMNDPDRYNAAVDRCFPRFHAWAPQFAAQSPVIRRWQTPSPPGALSHWQLLKASALFHLRAQSLRKKKRIMGEDGSTAFVFHMAGRELCWIKVHSCGARQMSEKMWRILKPKKTKQVGMRDGAGGRRGWGGGGGGGRAAVDRKKGRDGERRFGTGRMVDDGDGRDGYETEYASAAEEFGEDDDE